VVNSSGLELGMWSECSMLQGSSLVNACPVPADSFPSKLVVCCAVLPGQ